ncbi:unnamed protein product [Amoebophrya sp. A25]|nr:unnamed protein product [Amoebophrya sp. A25]|eukprot:GSA25T00021346001.1
MEADNPYQQVLAARQAERNARQAERDQRRRRLDEEDENTDLVRVPEWLRAHLPLWILRNFFDGPRRLTHSQLRRIVYSTIWLVGAAYFQSQIYVILSGICFIFLSLGARQDDDGVSAYSIFNRGARHVLGDLRGDQVDREHRGIAHMRGQEGGGGRQGDRGGGGLQEGGDDLGGLNLRQQMRSRDANKPCPCGSGKKLKKCCGQAT